MAKISSKITVAYCLIEMNPKGEEYEVVDAKTHLCDLVVRAKDTYTATIELRGGKYTVRHHQRYLNSIELREVSLNRALQFVKWVLKNGFQDLERTWMTVDLVYETRWDCPVAPERVRQAA